MYFDFLIAFCVSIFVLLVIGVSGNLFILVSNLNTVRSQQGLPPSDFILTGLSTCNIIFQISNGTIGVLLLLDVIYTMQNYAWRLYFYITELLVSIGFWFTAWLCVFYCAKIIRSSSRLVIQIQQWIVGAVPHLLVWSAVGNFVVCTPKLVLIFLRNETKTSCNSSFGHFRESKKWKLDYMNTFYLALCCLSPLVIMITSSSFIILFLRRHVAKIRRNTTNGFSSPSSEAYVRVSKMVLSLMGIYSTFDVCFMISLFTTNEVLFLIIIFLCHVYSSVTAALIILGTTKLRKRFNTVCWSKCCNLLKIGI
uniref:Taste receptor type 2 n=2 Tax=Latimeria chalumnae TaxID=7897 RepID=H3A7N0_LATCH